VPEDGQHLRPSFPSRDDFAAATTTDDFQFLVSELSFSAPRATDLGERFEIRYDGPGTAVLLSWNAQGGRRERAPADA
jgi:hypothetical protein